MEPEKILFLLVYGSTYSAAIPILVSIVRYSRLTVGLKILTLYFIISGLTDLVSFILGHYFNHNTYFLQPGFTVLEFALFSLYFSTLFKNRNIKYLLLI